MKRLYYIQIINKVTNEIISEDTYEMLDIVKSIIEGYILPSIDKDEKIMLYKRVYFNNNLISEELIGEYYL